MTDMRWNPPPGWPTPPAGWQPPPGWMPQREWPSPPAGWQWWVPASTPSRAPSYVLGASAFVLAVTPFLPWVEAVFIGSLSLSDLTRIRGGSDSQVYVASVILIALGTLAMVRRPGSAILLSLAAIASLLYCADLVVNVSAAGDDLGGAVRLGTGPYVAGLTALVMLAAGVTAIARGVH